MRRILSDEQVADIRRCAASGESFESLADRFHVCAQHVSHIFYGHSRTKPMRRPADPRKRFMSLVRVEDSHWIWIGCTDRRGNGWFNVSFTPKRAFNANRASWVLFRAGGSPLTRNDYVMRTCGRVDCVAPWHLARRRVGTSSAAGGAP
jgi:hypothetical protein